MLKTMEQKLFTITNEIEKIVVGRKKEITLLLTALLARGHVLLEDLPGMGKTTMARAFSRSLNCSFARVQCTADLLPSDVIGTAIYKPQSGEFEFRKGPIFTNILLIDEINRTLPRTQSSFLESMEEFQVSVERNTYQLEAPFFVIATQNPIEMEGTFPLPEAQLDRFLMKIELGYPSPEDEIKMIETVGDSLPYEQIATVFTPQQIVQMQQECESVTVHPSLIEYIVTLANQTRQHPLLAVGISPRATKTLYKTSKAWAYLRGRDYVIPDDIKEIIFYVWAHRLHLKMEAQLSGSSARTILQEIVDATALPTEKVGRFHG